MRRISRNFHQGYDWLYYEGAVGKGGEIVSNPETVLLQQIRLALGQIDGVVLFRNSIGHDGRAHVDYGIQNPGGSDLIGWVTRGGVAIFLAIEVKTATGIVSQEQKDFIALVRKNQGLAGVARSVADAEDIARGFIRD